MASPETLDHPTGALSPRSPETIRLDRPAAHPMEEDLIPPLVNISPAIFVRLEESILTPLANPPKTEAERLRLIIQRLDRHAEAVKANLTFLFRREQKRIVQAARAHEAKHGVQDAPPLDRSHADAMLHNMLQPPVPGRDYTVQHPLAPLPVQQWPKTPRERMVEQLLTTAEGAMTNLDGFDGMMAGLRDTYKKALEVEEKKERAEEARRSGGIT